MTTILLCVAALLAVAVAAVGCARARWATPVVYGACSVIALVALAEALRGLLGGATGPSALVLPMGLPWLGMHVAVDPLASFFLVVINLGAAAASFYAIGYGRHEQAPQRVLPFYPAFLAGMNMVVMAADAFTFLLSWEFMSLASWALVMAQHQLRENTRAGYLYIVMASFGTLALLLAFGLMAGVDGGYGFDAMRAASFAPWQQATVLALVLIGAGSKAGLVPLHVWLPLAHPAAPSHVSALMSGVMTKVAVYAFVRVVFDLIGATGWELSIPVLILGGVTAVMGVLYALIQNDLKRLLAYSTVENLGIIFIGLGLAMSFRANGLMALAALTLTAALFHVLNHSLFKSLLFCGAGAVLNATGLRDMDRLGGLVRPLAVTSFCFLLGCAAISALPPLNGFASEWLMFQAILQAPELPQWGLRLAVPVAGALLALAAALAAACFIRAFGVAFLGRPRSAAAASAHEVDGVSRGAMLLLAALCLITGIFPGVVVDMLGLAVGQILGTTVGPQADLPWLSLVPVSAGRSSYNPLLVLVFVAAVAGVTALVARSLARAPVRRGPAWDCGFPDASPLTQYGGGSFAQPLRRVFGAYVFRAREHVDMPPPGDLRAARLRVALHDLIWDRGYAPVAAAVHAVSVRMNGMQALTIRRYLSMIFIFLIFLLVVLALWF